MKFHSAVPFLTVAILAWATACGNNSGNPGGASSQRAPGGPLERPQPHGWAVGVTVGEPFTDGLEILRLGGKDPAVIDDVRLRSDDGLTLVGVKLVGPGRALGAVQFARSWPPTSDRDLREEKLRPISEQLIPLQAAPAGWELLLGLRADKPGVLRRTAIEIDYTVGGTKYTVVRPAELVVCAARDSPPEDCAAN